MVRLVRLALVSLLIALITFPALSEAQGTTPIAGLPLGKNDIEDLHAKLPNLDTRTVITQPTTQQLAAVSTLNASASWNRFGTPQSLINYNGDLGTISGNDVVAGVRSWLGANATLFKLTNTGSNRLELLNDNRIAGTSSRVLLFRQKFGTLTAVQDGMVTVGVANNRIAYVSSSLIGNASTPAAPSITPEAAWLLAAKNVGKTVGSSALGTTIDLQGWKVFDVAGFGQQRVRLRAFPIQAGLVHSVYEVNVVKNDPLDMMAYTLFVDGRTQQILWRQNRINTSTDEHSLTTTAARPVAVPVVTPFSGTYKDAPEILTCGPKHPFAVPAGTRQILVSATATVPANDIELFLLAPNGIILASADTATSPEVIAYSPQGGLAAGTYSVQVCPYNEPTAPPTAPYTYSGTVTTNDVPLPEVQVYPPQWKFFTSTPPLNYASTDTRTLACWESVRNGTPIPGCQIELRNTAARAPWDYDVNAGAPTYTTLGNGANTSEAWVSPLTPAEQYRPVSAQRQYTYPWTNQWYTSRCDPASLASPQRNDIDAATTNLFAMHNRMHDWSYFLGFTEQNYNAQQDNFGNQSTGVVPGGENDPETGNAQAGAISGGAPSYLGRDNANQIALQDGIPGISNMYLWQPIAAAFYGACVDGDYDMSIIGHEYSHLISNRMVGGPDANLTGHQAGSMGESWGDLVAVEYLNEFGFIQPGANPFTVGAYVTQNNATGIRNYNMSNNPLNYSNIGYDFAGPEVHSDGEIWDGTNYLIRQRMLSKYPAANATRQRECAEGKFNAAECPGNRRWMQIVFDAFLLMQPSVSMLDARDAYLAADRMRFNGANQQLLWQAFAQKGMGTKAASNGSDDTDPKPSFESPVEVTEPLITFNIVEKGTGKPLASRIYVGKYEARSRPVASSNGSATPPVVRFIPGTYDFTVRAAGYGLHSFKVTVATNQNQTATVEMEKNLASSTNGATFFGNGATTGTTNRDYNLKNLFDDTESTVWSRVGLANADAIDDTMVTVDLAGGVQTVSRVKLSAMLRPADPNDPGGDTGSQSRFSALRGFEIYTCNATVKANCQDQANYTKVYTNKATAFPGTLPRPAAPTTLIKSFNVTTVTTATHVRLRVLSNQCSGNTLFQGEQDNDPLNNTDCRGAAAALNVRAAEFEVYASPMTASLVSPDVTVRME